MQASHSIGCFRAAPLVVALVAHLALGCSDNDESATTPEGAQSGAFTPAVIPSDECALLTLDDLAPILANPGTGMPEPGVTNDDVWLRDCFWHPTDANRADNVFDPTVNLTVAGALNEAIAPELLGPPATNRGGTREELSGVGDEAAYFVTSFNESGVAANSGSYSVEVSASHIDPPVAKEAFIPLVRKVIDQLR